MDRLSLTRIDVFSWNSPKLLEPSRHPDQIVFFIQWGFDHRIGRHCSLIATDEVVRSTILQMLNTAGYIVSLNIVRRNIRLLGIFLTARKKIENAEACRVIDGQAVYR